MTFYFADGSSREVPDGTRNYKKPRQSGRVRVMIPFRLKPMELTKVSGAAIPYTFAELVAIHDEHDKACQKYEFPEPIPPMEFKNDVYEVMVTSDGKFIAVLK